MALSAAATRVMQRYKKSFCIKDISFCRDVFNEKPSLEEVGPVDGAAGGDEAAEVLPRGAVIHTTKGDITLKLFPDECPKTVENFTTHARNGYYEGIIFHRVIKGFMLQTGDPLGAPLPFHPVPLSAAQACKLSP